MLSLLARVRIRLAVSALLAVFWAAEPAWGWVDKTFESDSVTLDLARDGTAVVSHEILLGIRGGPLPEIGVEPVDGDAELLPEATVTAAKSGVAAGYPLPLLVTKDGARVRLHVAEGKGLRSGTYQIKFRYRTSLAASGKIGPAGSLTRIEWKGLEFPDGMDAAKIVFRVPQSATPPRLRASAAFGGEADVADDGAGVFLGTLRRGNDKDELEVVRPHVAKGEGVLWSALVDRATFELPALDSRGVVPEAVPHAVPLGAAPRRPPSPHLPLAWGGLFGVLYSVLVAWKGRGVEGLCRARRALPRPLVPVPLGFRALVAALFASSAVALVLLTPMPWLAAASLLGAMAAATYLPPRAGAPLRGPGKWTRLSPELAFDDGTPAPPHPTRFLDAGNPLGFVLFTALLMGFVAGAIVVTRSSPFHGVALLLGAAALFPPFFTGRAAELPPDPTRAPVALLEWIAEALGEVDALEVHPLVRVPLGATSHDELRLLVVPRRATPGLVGIEIGVEYRPGTIGFLALPFVLVRVLDGMPAAEALPKGFFWTRGRSPDERVAVLRPRVPTRKLTVLLARDVANLLSAGKEPPRRQPDASVARSAGRGASTAKAGTTSSPAHAT